MRRFFSVAVKLVVISHTDLLILTRGLCQQGERYINIIFGSLWNYTDKGQQFTYQISVNLLVRDIEAKCRGRSITGLDNVNKVENKAEFFSNAD